MNNSLILLQVSGDHFWIDEVKVIDVCFFLEMLLNRSQLSLSHRLYFNSSKLSIELTRVFLVL